MTYLPGRKPWPEREDGEFERTNTGLTDDNFTFKPHPQPLPALHPIVKFSVLLSHKDHAVRSDEADQLVPQTLLTHSDERRRHGALGGRRERPCVAPPFFKKVLPLDFVRQGPLPVPMVARLERRQLLFSSVFASNINTGSHQCDASS